MPDPLLPTLAKALLPAAAIAGMLFAAKRKKLSFADDLGFKPPAMGIAALCLFAWICLIAVEEYLTGSIADVQARRWPDYPAVIIALRILAIGLIGPIAEELAFRGLLMAWLRRIRVGAVWAILIAAALWSVIHLQYAPVVLLIIFIDGIALGVARHVSGSLYVPIVMHVSGNLFSIYQSLAW